MIARVKSIVEKILDEISDGGKILIATHIAAGCREGAPCIVESVERAARIAEELVGHRLSIVRRLREPLPPELLSPPGLVMIPVRETSSVNYLDRARIVVEAMIREVLESEHLRDLARVLRSVASTRSTIEIDADCAKVFLRGAELCIAAGKVIDCTRVFSPRRLAAVITALLTSIRRSVTAPETVTSILSDPAAHLRRAIKAVRELLRGAKIVTVKSFVNTKTTISRSHGGVCIEPLISVGISMAPTAMVRAVAVRRSILGAECIVGNFLVTLPRGRLLYVAENVDPERLLIDVDAASRAYARAMTVLSHGLARAFISLAASRTLEAS